MPPDQILFARLTKYDESTGYFEATATSEAVDKAREICDYETSKPRFQAWSETISKASGGKSLGNIREMHSKVAAGRVLSIDFRDAEKAIFITGEAVDEGTRVKLSKGVLTGVSIGGSYAKKWPDPVNKGVIRYTADPAEISLVDNPCNPESSFLVIKADKTEEMRKFAAPVDPEKDAVDQLAKLVNDGAVKPSTLLALAKAQAAPAVDKPAALRKALDNDKLTNGDLERLGKEYLAADQQDCDIFELLRRLDTAAAPRARAMPVAFSEEFQKKLAADARVTALSDEQFAQFLKGLSMNGMGEMNLDEALGKLTTAAPAAAAPPAEIVGLDFADPINKKYPIDAAAKPAHLWAAWAYISKAANAAKHKPEDVEKIKAAITTRWKAGADKAGPRAASEAGKSAADHLMRKGLYTVGRLAEYLEGLNYLLEAYEYEQTMEGDDSAACKALDDAVSALAGAFAMMAQEEAAELMNGETTDVIVMELAAGVHLLAKREPKAPFLAPIEILMAKAGARHSKGDMAHVQGIHDHAAKLGADCAGAEKAAPVVLCKAAGLADDATVSQLTKAVEGLMAKAKKWDDMPAPTRGVLRAMDKSAETVTGAGANGQIPPEVEALIKAAELETDPEKKLQAVIKLTHRYGGQRAPIDPFLSK